MNFEEIDRLSINIAKVLHGLFGFSYDKNTESYGYIETFDTAADFSRNDSLPGSISITQEADFVATRVQCNARFIASTTATQIGSLMGTSAALPVAGDNPDAPFLLSIKDGGTDRQMQNEPLDAHLCYGVVGGLPGIWAKPRLFARNSNISLTAVLLKNAVESGDQLRLTVAFLGWKIYDAASLDLTSRRA